MTNQLQSELLKAANSTFERLGFVLPDEQLQEWQESASLDYRTRVSFSGPVRGELVIRISEDVASEMAANMLGLFDGADGSVIEDALGEIANVICGNLVPALGRPEDVFDLGAPETTLDPSQENEPSAAPIARVDVGLDEGRAELLLFVEDQKRHGEAA